MHDGALIQYAAPAPVVTFSNGDESLQVCSLKAVLQQLLRGVDVLRDALHALVQHPRALPDLALGKRGEKRVWRKWWRIRRERCENLLQIGKNDAWNRVRGLCSIPSHPHTCRHLQEYRGVNSETDTALCLSHSSFPLVLHLSTLSYQIILYWGNADGAFPPLSLVDKVRIQIIRLGKRQSLPVFFTVDLQDKQTSTQQVTKVRSIQRAVIRGKKTFNIPQEQSWECNIISTTLLQIE